MRIRIKISFSKKLERQIEYIARDSPSNARKFKNELNEMNEGKAGYQTLEDLENTLESAVKKHENKD